jgi:transposase-like protein
LLQRALAVSSLHLLGRIDQDLAAAVRSAGCRYCRSPVHSATYLRKPRGGPETGSEEDARRLSFCCSAEGCRRRHTPASVRFLGRRVYSAAAVVLACALRHGPTPMRLAELRRLFGVDRRTVMRWRRWWTEELSASELWRRLRGRLPVRLDERQLPLSLLESMTGTAGDRLVSVLCLLAPLGASRCCAW